MPYKLSSGILCMTVSIMGVHFVCGEYWTLRESVPNLGRVWVKLAAGGWACGHASHRQICCGVCWILRRLGRMRAAVVWQDSRHYVARPHAGNAMYVSPELCTLLALQDAGWTVSDVPDDYRVEKPSQARQPCPSLPKCRPVRAWSRGANRMRPAPSFLSGARSPNSSSPLQSLQDHMHARA